MTKSFQDLSIADLVQIHNTVASAKPVKTFRTKADAQKRVLGYMTEANALERLDGVDGVEPEPKSSESNLSDLPLSDPRHPLHVSEEKAAERKQAWEANPPKPLATPFVVPAHQVLTETKTRRRRKDSDSMIVVVLAAENPHRIKSAAGQRFAMFKSGQTVEDFISTWATVNDGRAGRVDKKRARRARRQVRKDAAKGHIKLVTRGEWLKETATSVAA